MFKSYSCSNAENFENKSLTLLNLCFSMRNYSSCVDILAPHFCRYLKTAPTFRNEISQSNTLPLKLSEHFLLVRLLSRLCNLNKLSDLILFLPFGCVKIMPRLHWTHLTFKTELKTHLFRSNSVVTVSAISSHFSFIVHLLCYGYYIVYLITVLFQHLETLISAL